ncbi:MAG: aldo/keto reductase [Pelomonas sp.]|nr:aldo/keto reductase [Roseateles sp.]MBV8469026.1 aldo/keto reductase [Burkholderiaceae bacterium]MBV8605091.1 aldo/keto reductase [Roseateles sp.]
MITQELGRTGLRISQLGFGVMQAGDPGIDEAAAGRLLHEALDMGITLLDTARSYQLSEERIGRHLRQRRGEFVLSTKLGYGVDGVADWTAECIVQGVERALRVMHTDVIDIVHLHSCPLETLQRGEVVEALARCREQGKLRVAAYSGENEALDFAIACGQFQSVQTSLNLVDQGNLDFDRLRRAQEAGMGVLVKRPLASLAWRHAQRPDDFALGLYWDRWQAMGLERALPGSGAWTDLSLRFAAFQSGVSACLVGSTRAQALRDNAGALALGPLPEATLRTLRRAWQENCPGAEGVI